MEVGAWKPVLVYQNNDNYNVDGVSKYGDFVALSKSITTSENQLFLYDLKNKQLKEISEAGKPGKYGARGVQCRRQNVVLYYGCGQGICLPRPLRPSRLGARQTAFETNWDVMYSYRSENRQILSDRHQRRRQKQTADSRCSGE